MENKVPVVPEEVPEGNEEEVHPDIVDTITFDQFLRAPTTDLTKYNLICGVLTTCAEDGYDLPEYVVFRGLVPEGPIRVALPSPEDPLPARVAFFIKRLYDLGGSEEAVLGLFDLIQAQFTANRPLIKTHTIGYIVGPIRSPQ